MINITVSRWYNVLPKNPKNITKNVMHIKINKITLLCISKNTCKT